MFDIRIGTVIPADKAPEMMAQLNPTGFESYELDFNGRLPRMFEGMEEHAKAVLNAADGSDRSRTALSSSVRHLRHVEASR